MSNVYSFGDQECSEIIHIFIHLKFMHVYSKEKKIIHVKFYWYNKQHI
jgi:hypothetical protein